MSTSDRLIRCLVVVVLAGVLSGCAAQKAYHRAEKAMERQNFDEAVLNYSKAVALSPGNTRYELSLERAKLKAAHEHFQKGKRFAASEQWDLAIAEYQQSLLLHPGHQFATTELEKAVRELRRRQIGPSEIEQLKEQARRLDSGPPQLDPRSNIPILLMFTDVEIGKIFEAIGKASGINFIFDEKTDLQKPMTIDIGNVSLEKALDILMLQTKNFYKVIDEHTLLVAPDTRQKRQEYEDQVIRTFFLSNADTKEVVTLIRALLQSRQLAENTELNSVTIKDTPDKVAIAERIINSNDKSKGEVLIDVELLEINRTVSRTLGIDLSSKTLSLTFRDGQAALGLNDLDSLNQQGNWTLGIIPSVVLNFLKSDSDTKAIAKPQLRVSEGEQAEILIGDRVPIPTTSFNTSQTIGGNIVPITSFTYQNVGITVQIEPRVHHNREVTLRVQVEVSQISDFVDTGGGQQQPIIGTRQIQTVIRLRDGETNMLAGLISRSDTDTVAGVAGISDIPVLRRVLGNNTSSKRETDIVMTLTPRIIRIPDITEEDLVTLWVGTEENMRLRGSARHSMQAGPFSPTPFEGPEPTAGGRGGAITRITPSEEVMRDREETARQIGNGTLPPPEQFEPEPAAPEGQPEAVPEIQQPEIIPDQPVDEPFPEPEPPPDEEPQDQARNRRGRRSPNSQEAPIDTAANLREGSQDQGAQDSLEPRAETDANLDEGNQDQGAQDDQEPPVETIATLFLDASPQAQVGDAVTVSVGIAGARSVGAIPFRLRYNPQVLEYVGGQQGSFLSSAGGPPPVFLATGQNGEIVVGLSRTGGPGAQGDGELARFEFRAIGAGRSRISLDAVSLKDPGGRPMSVTIPQVRNVDVAAAAQ